MLILTRRLTETLVFGGSVTITVLDIKGSRVRFGVNAPRDLAVRKDEAVRRARSGHRTSDAGS